MSDTGGGFGPAGRPMRSTPFRFGLLAAVGALLAFVGFLALRQLATVATMLAVAMFLAIGLNRPVRALVRRGMKRGLAVTLLTLGTGVVVGVALVLIVPSLVTQVHAFFDALPGHLQQTTGHAPTAASQLGASVGALVTPQNVARLVSGLLGGAATVAGALFITITTVMLSLFLLVAFDRVMDGAYRFVVGSRRERARRLGDAMMESVGAYLTGALMIAACAATAALLWCVIAGVPYPLMLALVVGVADMIPQVGATIGSIVVIAVALTVSLPTALLTLLFFVLYQGVENWVVYPRMMSRAVKISNLAAIVSALTGGALLGIFGVLIAVPAYASIQLLVREVVFPRQDAR